jgi:hypothetical protein
LSSFNGYPLFFDVRNPILRAYNRINIYLNIKERYGVKPADRYLKKFNRDDKVSIFQLMQRINRDGFEQVRRDLRRNKEICR